MPKLLKWTIALLLLAAIGAVVWQIVAPPSAGPGVRTAVKSGGMGKGKGRRPTGDAIPVLAAAAETADVPVYLDGLGTARALNTVTVQPLVDGRLISVDFKEGQDVKKGDLLARIDPAIYEAQLAQAVARKAQDEAQLADARRELDRVSRVGPIATLQKSVDTARAKVAQFEALVKADQAAIDLAQTNLDFTRVVAPIDGRTGIRLVDQGNVVRASASSAIVIITQVQPIAVLFNLPQQQLPRINAAILASGPGGELAADALAADGRTIVERGVLRVVDNQVDQATGTVRLKAEFPNKALALWPGQFVNVRIQVDNLRNVVVVPTAAVQQGPSGPFVYVVSSDSTALVRPVRIAAQDERLATIATGVARGEQVVTSSFARLREDSALSVTLQPLTGPREVAPTGRGESGSAPPPAGEGRRAMGKGKEGGDGERRGRRREAAAEADAAPAPGASGTDAGTGAAPAAAAPANGLSTPPGASAGGSAGGSGAPGAAGQ